MAGKTYQTTFELGGQINPSFKKTFDQANGKMGKMRSKMGSFGAVGGAMGQAISKVGSIAGNTFSRISSGIVSGVTAPFRSAIGIVKDFGGALGLLSAGSLVNSGLNRLSAIENAEVSLRVMMGDEDKAKGFLDDVLAFAKTTPFAFPDLAESARNLVAFGMDSKKVVPTLKAIGDAAAASGKGSEGLNQVAGAFGDMQVSGTLSMDQINRLSSAGVPALKILANQTGISVDKMKKQISSGKMSSVKAIDDLVKGMQEGTKGIAGPTAKMAGIMEEMKGTWTGSIDSLKSSFSSSMAKLMTPVKPYLIKGMKWIGSTFSKLPDLIFSTWDKLKPFRDNLSNMIAFAVPYIQKGVSAIKGAIGPISNFVGPIIKSLGGIGTAIKNIFQGNLTGASFNIASALGLDSEAVGLISSVLQNIVGTVGSYTQQAVDFWKSMMPYVKSIVGSIVTGVKGVIPIFLKVYSAIQQVMSKVIKAIIPVVTYLAGKLLPIIAKVYSFIANQVVPRVSAAISALVPVFVSTSTKVVGAFTALSNFLKPIIDGIVAAFNFGFPFIQTIVIGVIDQITVVVKGLIGVLGGIIDFVTGVFTGNWSQAWTGVVDTFGSIFGMLKGLVATPINAVIRLVNMAIESINKVSVDIPDWLGGGTLGFNIPNIPEIPAYAKGGIADRPSIFGEAGPEIAIPLNNKPRSHSLLDSANRIMGRESGGQGANNSGDVYIEYSPVYQIQGSTEVKGDVERAAKMSQTEFEKMYGKMIKNKKQVSFA